MRRLLCGLCSGLLRLRFRLGLFLGFLLEILLLLRDRRSEFRNRGRKFFKTLPGLVHVRTNQIERHLHLSRNHLGFGLRRNRQTLHVRALLHFLRQSAPLRQIAGIPKNLLSTFKSRPDWLLGIRPLIEPRLRLRHFVRDSAQAALQPAPVTRRLRACAEIPDIPPLVRCEEREPIESLQEVVAGFQNAKASIHLAEARFDHRFVATRIKLFHRIHRDGRHPQVAHKLIVGIRPQLLEIAVRLDDCSPRRPALVGKRGDHRFIARSANLNALNVFLHLRDIAIGRAHILENLLDHLHRLVAKLPVPVGKVARVLLQRPREFHHRLHQSSLRRLLKQCSLEFYTTL